MTSHTAWTAGSANWRPPAGRATSRRSSPQPAWQPSASTGDSVSEESQRASRRGEESGGERRREERGMHERQNDVDIGEIRR